MGAIAAGVIGAGMAIGGTAMQANAAAKRKAALRRIAETPGLNLGDQINEAGDLMPRTQQLEGKRNQFNADQLNSLLETSMPGYAKARDLRMGNTMSMLRGEIPLDVQQQMFRTDAARSLEGGFGGSGAGRNLVARDFGMTSLGLQGQGASSLAQIIGTTPHAALANFTFTPEQIAAMRAEERRQRMAASFSAEQAPGTNDVWGKQLQQAGDKIGMAGLSGGMGGGGGGGMSAGGGGGMTDMMRS